MSNVNYDAYALALYEIAIDNKSLKQITAEVKQISNLLSIDKNFSELLNNFNISKDDRKAAIAKVFKKFDKNLVYWLFAIIDNNVTFYIDQLLNKFIEFSNKHFNIMIVKAYSPFSLQIKDIEKIKKVFLKKYHVQCEITNIIDSNLLGGVKLEFNGKTIDNTIRGKLEKIKLETFQNKSIVGGE